MKILTLGIAILTCVTASAAVSFTADDIAYEIIDGTNNVKVIAPTAGSDTYTGAVTIPDKVNNNSTDYTVTEINVSAFRGSSVTSVTIPNTVTAIGSYAFDNCTSLTTVTFGSGSKLKTIGKYAFMACSELTGITIPDAVTEIGKQAFYTCKKLSTLTIGKSVETIGESAFDACTALTSVVIPYSVVTVANYAFDGCTSLESLTIGASVRTIGQLAFRNCTALTSITIFNANPLSKSPTAITVGTSAFNSVLNTATLYVPSGSLEKYSGTYADPWNKFTNKKEFTNPYILDEGTGYTDAENSWHTTISYTRNFTSTNWQALFLPFAMNYEDWSEKGTIAELTNVTAEGVLEWTTISSGSIEAGKPYIFKPNAADDVTFSVSNATLSSYETATNVTSNGYTLSGTYVTKNDMATTKSYALYNGSFYYTTSDAKTLKPFRIFLNVPELVYETKAPVRMSIDGEDVTGIEDVLTDVQTENGVAYNLQGIPVDDNYRGIVIVNGKKVLRK